MPFPVPSGTNLSAASLEDVKIRNLTIVLSLIAAVSGCAGSTDAVLQAMKYVVQKDTSAARAQLNPNFVYLRATVDGRVALLALGFVDDHPQGPIQVWYSAQREVLRLQNGRIVGAVGLNAEWRNVVVPDFPPWSRIVEEGGVFRWVRSRDVMPGYRYGVRDTLALRAIAAPSRTALSGLEPGALTWFEERFEDASGEIVRDAPLPPARYAIANAKNSEASVVYAEQCLTPALCFSWQKWPVAAQPAKETP